MNILPNKSWHVRTRKNIDRVKRDEAEAERLSKIERDRQARIDQEIRLQALRDKQGIERPKDTHFSLFETDQPDQIVQTVNKDLLKEKRRVESDRLERLGISKSLSRSKDNKRPWYSNDTTISSVISKFPSSSKLQTDPKLITSIYDPMIAMQQAEEIHRKRRKRHQK